MKKVRLITRRRWVERTDLELSVDELLHRLEEIFRKILEKEQDSVSRLVQANKNCDLTKPGLNPIKAKTRKNSVFC